MRRMSPLFICVALCAAQTSPEPDTSLDAFLGHQLPPVDQATGHPDLLEFRSRIIAAARRHDLKYLLSVVDPKIGGCGWEGIDGFRFFLSDADGWDGLRIGLQLGGIMPSPTRFRSNYVMVTFPDHADMTSYLVAIKPDAAVRERPELSSAVVGKLHYEIVIPIGEAEGEWQKIRYQPDKLGYVQSSDLQRPTGYSVDLGRVNGKWRIKWVANYCD
jgi:hypothetical protein